MSQADRTALSEFQQKLAKLQRAVLDAGEATQTQVDQYNIAADEFKAQLTKLKVLVETDLARHERAVDAAGAPWTPGRLPEWNDR